MSKLKKKLELINILTGEKTLISPEVPNNIFKRCLTEAEKLMSIKELIELDDLDKKCRKIVDDRYGMTLETGQGGSDYAAEGVFVTLRKCKLVKVKSFTHGNTNHEFLYIHDGILLYPYSLYEHCK